jgi:dCTP deaminase
MPDPIPLTPGVLANDQLELLIKKNHIGSLKKTPKVGASAVDLRIASKAWRLRTGQRPTTRELSKIQAQSEEMAPTNGFFEFQPKSIYLVQLDQHLSLPSNVSGRASGKSSVGRLDVITRLITQGSREYDLVPAGYEGPLHLLLMPQTFAIRVAPEASVNQLRLFSGAHSGSVITRDQIYDYGTRFWYVLKAESDSEYESWGGPERLTPTDDPLLFDLTVDLADYKFPYVYKAKQGVIESIDLAADAAHNPADYFEKVDVMVEGRDRSVVLEQGSFYIMKSRERLHIPEDVAVEVVAISERIGDIRIHYAGFAHPGFGLGERPERRGTPLIFEVRATDMDTKLYDKSVLARIQLFRMSERAKADPSKYETQELKLSNVFADWPAG